MENTLNQTPSANRTHIGFFVLLILSAVAVGVGQSFARKQASSTK